MSYKTRLQVMLHKEKSLLPVYKSTLEGGLWKTEVTYKSKVYTDITRNKKTGHENVSRAILQDSKEPISEPVEESTAILLDKVQADLMKAQLNMAEVQKQILQIMDIISVLRAR